jgi:threonyl-tRNA synthetase
MKILQLDVNSIEFEPIKPEVQVYEKDGAKKESIKEALVLMTAIEAGDSEEDAKQAVKGAIEFAGKLKRNTLVLYPFAHVSSNLEKPKRAMELFLFMVDEASKSKLDVHHAPFGWNKSLKLDVKAHPLAEMSRNYGSAAPARAKKKESEPGDSNALKEEEKVVSKWYILDPRQGLVDADKFDYKGHENLKKFADYEIKKVRAYQQMPAHITLMKKLQLVDHEPGSDPGNFRHYPNGKLIKSLLERYVTDRVIDYGSVEVETPIMYDYTHPSLAKYLERFPARHYVVKSEEKEYFLRFSACFGQFLMMHDATISYKQLPFKMYELTRYSFRREKSGELVGLKRMRAFTMPDMHTMCADLKQAEEEFDKQFKFCQTTLDEIGIKKDEYEAAIRFTEGFWKENKEFVTNLVKNYLKKPALIETWSFRYAYFDPKFEFNVVDSMSKASALSTVQIDHENGETYDLNYTDKDGSRKHPIILHCSPSGAVERVLYALLELSEIKQKQGKVQMLPVWLSPTQIRLLPISEKYVDKCVELAEKIKAKDIRVDVDDSNDTLGKKISNAEKEWVPYICVVGEKEVASGELAIRIRETKKQENLSLDVLIKRVDEGTGSMPRAPLSVPMMLSKRPTFNG